MRVLVRGGNCLDFAGDAVLLYHYSDVRPLEGALGLLDWRCNAVVSRLVKKKTDLFEYGRMSILAPQGKIPSSKALITGLGPRSSFDADLRREILRISLLGVRRVGGLKIALDTGILERDLGENIPEDLTGIIEESDLGPDFTIALFRYSKRSAGEERGCAGRPGEP
jgi:hypothetical protein